ncbi:MAG: MOSC domain-containing protein [Thiomicrorhabdus sp.]|nr:MOSC domain-containing protein [Thiomicrorhabdus sp.]
MPKLIGIATHKEPKGAIIQHQSIQVHLKTGLENDYRGQCNPHTQVTLLSAQTWNHVCQTLSVTLDWTERRANLLVDDIDFSEGNALIGQQVQVGQVLLEITAETDPCARMEQLCTGLKEALTPTWNGGIRCKVLKEGIIQIGDKIHLLKRI